MSQTAVMTLTEFLTARLDEDEAELPRGYLYPNEPLRRGWALPPADREQAKRSLARARAEVAAKRRIVEQAAEATLDHDETTAEHACTDEEREYAAETDPGNLILRALASVYADHPDYDPEWS